MKLTKTQRAALRLKFGGRCAYCGEVLPEKGWHADHVEPVLRISEVDEKARQKGVWKLKATGSVTFTLRDSLDNHFPACAPCNLFKATYSVEVFREQIAKQVARARATSVNFRTAERFGQIQVTTQPVVFWFERYQGCGQARPVRLKAAPARNHLHYFRDSHEKHTDDGAGFQHRSLLRARC